MTRMRQYHIKTHNGLTEKQFELAKGTSLMNDFLHNMICIDAREDYVNGAGNNAFYYEKMWQLPDVMADYLANNTTGPYFFLKADTSDRATLFLSNQQDAVAFKLRFHGVRID